MPWQHEILTYPHRMERDLSIFQTLDRAFQFPHRFFRSVHVAGTNGKGSVSLKIAKGLEKEGYKVGLYSSPHIEDLRERIQINSSWIEKEPFCALFDKVKPLAKGASFFDVMTLIAFLYFQEERVDWAVIEVGLGGRLDATNVILPKLSVITSIGMDHAEILGNTLEDIAREKGGIVKPGVPLIVGPTAAPFFPGALPSEKAPFFDLENQGTAKLALQSLKVSPHAIEEGLRARPPCRFEVRGNIVLDGAHNPDGFARLLEALFFHFPQERKFRFVVAFSKTKDWRRCIDFVLPYAESIIASSHSIDRLEDPKAFCEYHPLIEERELGEEIFAARGIYVCCGSFYFLRSVLEIHKKMGALPSG